MKEKNVVIGRVYRYHPNGGRKFLLARVNYKGGGGHLTIRGAEKHSVPYNFARPEYLTQPKKVELQAFLEHMPL